MSRVAVVARLLVDSLQELMALPARRLEILEHREVPEEVQYLWEADRTDRWEQHAQFCINCVVLARLDERVDPGVVIAISRSLAALEVRMLESWNEGDAPDFESAAAELLALPWDYDGTIQGDCADQVVRETLERLGCRFGPPPKFPPVVSLG